jgi:hypothetical protein
MVKRSAGVTKYHVTRQYSVNETVEVEAGSWEEAQQMVIDDLGVVLGPAEFRDWLEKSNWPVYNVDDDKQEN